VNTELDKYYTPIDVARTAMEKASLSYAPKVCADSTCGMGHLLTAADEIFGPLHCIGFDRDRNAIRKLKRRNPKWSLAVGDLLSDRSYKRSFSPVIPQHVDLLVLNPPFSHGERKFVDITYDDQEFVGSIAMAHLFKSFEIFRPNQGAIVIAPESLLYSETDFNARKILSKEYGFRKLFDLKSSTFRGARANSTIIQISKNVSVENLPEKRETLNKVEISIVRGSLPVHLLKSKSKGTRYIHSTGIRHMVEGAGNFEFPLSDADSNEKGLTSGWCILIPRVGLPLLHLTKAINIKDQIQLSDCVISLSCASKSVAAYVERIIHSHWEDFRYLYRGTGARYVTVAKLRDWFIKSGILEKGSFSN
jgi:predicted RNA methylase